jgi:hypothetical protein
MMTFSSKAKKQRSTWINLSFCTTGTCTCTVTLPKRAGDEKSFSRKITGGSCSRPRISS